MTVSEVHDDGSVHCIWFAQDFRQGADYPAVVLAYADLGENS